MAFIGWLGRYLLVFICLAAVAGLGIFVGKKWSDKKSAKVETEATNTEE